MFTTKYGTCSFFVCSKQLYNIKIKYNVGGKNDRTANEGTDFRSGKRVL